MSTYDSFDICEAYWLYYCYWHSGGLTARDRAHKRSISCQLEALRFRPAMDLSEETLTDNGKEIYAALVAKWEGVNL